MLIGTVSSHIGHHMQISLASATRLVFSKFETVDLPLAGFEPYYRGKKQNQSAPLDKSQITNFEFQIYGGVYLPVKQAGTSSLEIDWVKAVP
ncbi:hypothetical protein J6590_033965 [Homalodisca vitripennis]|nr:hypothetical protein J6590_033965 [Homalodisca vitripennis]